MMPAVSYKMSVHQCNGLKFWCREGTTDEKAVKEVIQDRCYFSRDLQIEKQDRWADLGANIGAFSMLAASVTGHCKSFEPEPSNAELIARNAALNGCVDQVRILESVVRMDGSRRASLFLSNTARNRYRHSTIPGSRKNGIRVPSTPFQEAIEGCKCVKMDIEGAELAVLDQADLSGLRKLSFEYHFDFDSSIKNCARRIDRLKEFFDFVRHPKLPRVDRWSWFPAAIIIKAYNTL